MRKLYSARQSIHDKKMGKFVGDYQKVEGSVSQNKKKCPQKMRSLRINFKFKFLFQIVN